MTDVVAFAKCLKYFRFELSDDLIGQSVPGNPISTHINCTRSCNTMHYFNFTPLAKAVYH